MGIRERLTNQIQRAWRGATRAAYHGRLRRLARAPRLPDVRSAEPAVLFFAPDAGATSHFSAMCLAARTLQELGHRVLVAQCYQCFPRCTVVDLHGLPAQVKPRKKAQLCQDCAIHSLGELRRLELPTLELGAFLSPDLQASVREALTNSPENLLEFEYDGVNFGKLSCVDVSLSLKRSEYGSITGDDRRQWLDYIGASLTAYRLVDSILKCVPVKAVVHFNDYSLMLAARLAARKHKVPATTMSLAYHCNVDRRRIGLYSEVQTLHRHWLLQQWPQWRGLALSPERVRDIGDDLLHRWGGSGHTVYSPARVVSGPSVWDQLSISRKKKLVVAFTSSKDEVAACRMMLEGSGAKTPDRGPQPFVDQIEWLRSVVEHVRRRDDVQFVARIHPREGGGARSVRSSDHLRQLRAAFKTLPENCRFVWPEDKISSYDLGEAADLVLVSWSSMEQEMARLAVPVLRAYSFFEAPCPRDDFVQFADSEAGYFALFSRMLREPVSLETLLRAWRWQNLLYLDTTLDFGDVRERESPKGPEAFALSRQSRALESAILGGREVADINRERLLARQSTGAHLEEREALFRELRRIVHFLFTGQSNDRTEFHSLRQEEGGTVHYQTPSGVLSRYSPLISRLAGLLPQHINSAERAA